MALQILNLAAAADPARNPYEGLRDAVKNYYEGAERATRQRYLPKELESAIRNKELDSALTQMKMDYLPREFALKEKALALRGVRGGGAGRKRDPLGDAFSKFLNSSGGGRGASVSTDFGGGLNKRLVSRLEQNAGVAALDDSSGFYPDNNRNMNPYTPEQIDMMTRGQRVPEMNLAGGSLMPEDVMQYQGMMNPYGYSGGADAAQSLEAQDLLGDEVQPQTQPSASGESEPDLSNADPDFLVEMLKGMPIEQVKKAALAYNLGQKKLAAEMLLKSSGGGEGGGDLGAPTVATTTSLQNAALARKGVDVMKKNTYQKYRGVSGYKDLIKDISKYNTTSNQKEKDSLKRDLANAVAAYNLVAERSSMELEGEGVRATVPAIRHQRDAITSGWPKILSAARNIMPAEIIDESEYIRDKVLAEATREREGYAKKDFPAKGVETDSRAVRGSGKYSNLTMQALDDEGYSEEVIQDAMRKVGVKTKEELLEHIRKEGR